MITREFIIQKATWLQTSEINTAREYIQHLFLASLYQEKNSKDLLFKGGTVLRIVYRSPRFSEDLDFTGADISIVVIEDMMINTLSKIEREGVVCEMRESKKTSGGYLGIFQTKFFEYNINVQVEVSLRKAKNLNRAAVVIVNDFIPAYSIVTVSEDDLVKGKIQALLTRAKPRDWYDLYFILRANLLHKQERHVLLSILKKLETEDINVKEIKLLLPQSHHALLKTFKDTLTREIRRFV